jgi:hypothetical protein
VLYKQAVKYGRKCSCLSLLLRRPLYGVKGIKEDIKPQKLRKQNGANYKMLTARKQMDNP